MKYIEKSEPDIFKKWKMQQGLDNISENRKDPWGDLPSKIDEERKKNEPTLIFYSKKDLWKKLLQEQGYICAYCGRRLVKTNKIKIEHVIARSRYVALAFTYSNLVAVCQGGDVGDIDDKDSEVPLSKYHCDKKKSVIESKKRIDDEDPMIVKPTQEDCDSHFTYSSKDGTIGSKSDVKQINSMINDVLGLNVKRLKNIRGTFQQDKAQTKINELVKVLPVAQVKDIIHRDIKRIYDKEVLDECCFVEAYYLRKSIGL